MSIKRAAQAVVVVFLVIVSVGAVAYMASHYIDSQNQTSENSCDGAASQTHIVTIQNNQVTPAHTDGARCDTLTIKNQDTKTRDIAFGKHDEHKAYNGVESRVLTPGSSMTVVFNETGEYLFHDHYQESVQGTFTVH